MYSPRAISALIDQARTGDVAPHGDLTEAQTLIGFSFGLVTDAAGQLAGPGVVNDALARFIVNHEALRTKTMILQEELANAVIACDQTLASQIQSLKSIKSPGATYNTYELMAQVTPQLQSQHIVSLIVVAFRHHLPRAEAVVRKAGFGTITPDLRQVGDFDPASSQPWIRGTEAWIRRERTAINIFAMRNYI